MKMAVFWVVAHCSLVEVYRHFRGPCCLHDQGDALRLRRTIREKCNCIESKSKAVPLHAMVALGGRGGIAPTHS
jgi:hypothetical protein